MASAATPLLLALLLLGAGTVAGQPDGEPPDAWDLQRQLGDSLARWSAAPPAAPSPEAPFELALHAPTARLDTVTLAGDTLLRLRFPRYQGRISTVLHVKPTPEGPRWIVPLRWTGGGIRLDSVLIPAEGFQEPRPGLLPLIAEELTRLRALGLPGGRVSPAPGPDSLEVALKGRYPRTVTYSQAAWQQVLGAQVRRAAGQVVYAGLLSLERLEEGARADYYLLLAGQKGHHFLQQEDRLRADTTGGWTVAERRVRWIPFVRTDNLKDLFAEPDLPAPGSEAIPVHVRGREGAQPDTASSPAGP